MNDTRITIITFNEPSMNYKAHENTDKVVAHKKTSPKREHPIDKATAHMNMRLSTSEDYEIFATLVSSLCELDR